MEKKEKILFIAFRGAKAQFKTDNILFDDDIPKSFNDIKKYSPINSVYIARNCRLCTVLVEMS